MKFKKIISRFLTPSPFITGYYFYKYRAIVSFRAEFELSQNVSMGQGTTVGSFSKIKASDGPLSIGTNVSIANGCSIFAHGKKGITIGDDCLISPNVSMISSNYRYNELSIPIRNQGCIAKGIYVGNNVWIGTGVVILDGAYIGNGVIIAPNTVVSAKIPDNSIVQGNPAKIIFTRR